ncbi:hypothetical protein RCL1_009086 [Eukaryota sp. TZLM3-RCL]
MAKKFYAVYHGMSGQDIIQVPAEVPANLPEVPAEVPANLPEVLAEEAPEVPADLPSEEDPDDDEEAYESVDESSDQSTFDTISRYFPFVEIVQINVLSWGPQLLIVDVSSCFSLTHVEMCSNQMVEVLEKTDCIVNV